MARGIFAFSLVGTLLLIPCALTAATLRADQTLEVTTTPLGNTYLSGGEVRVSAPVLGDLLTAAGTLFVRGPVGGDVMSVAGTIDIDGQVTGDVRALGGRMFIEGDVGGELALFGGHITITGRGGEVRAAGGYVDIRRGARGPVTVYAGTVVLSGEFAGDVNVSASDRVIVAENTVIRGKFEYNAPQEVAIPASATMLGGVHYTGSSSFLPSVEEAKTFALAGIGVFLLVRLVARALAAGLVAGLFPVFARSVVDEALTRSFKRFFLLALLGFAVSVATPILLMFLVASFVGIGIALLIGIAYLFALLISYLYAAILIGAALMRLSGKRWSISWKSAILGMVALFAVGLIPVIGLLVTGVLSAVSLGAITLLLYRFSFGRSDGA